MIAVSRTSCLLACKRKGILSKLAKAGQVFGCVLLSVALVERIIKDAAASSHIQHSQTEPQLLSFQHGGPERRLRRQGQLVELQAPSKTGSKPITIQWGFIPYDDSGGIFVNCRLPFCVDSCASCRCSLNAGLRHGDYMVYLVLQKLRSCRACADYLQCRSTVGEQTTDCALTLLFDRRFSGTGKSLLTLET